MRIKIYTPMISCAILALTAIGFSQTQRIVRWDSSDASSKRVVRNDVIVKQLEVDGVDGITVTASIEDRQDSFSVNLEVRNRGKQDINIRPQEIQLQVVRLGSRNLAIIPADKIAKKLIDSENSRASRIEAAGATARKTVVEHVPVTEVKHNPGSINDVTQPAVTVETRIDIVHKTVPDDHARMAASTQASSIRLSAESNARRILRTPLETTRLNPGSRVAGAVYYVPDKNAQEVLLRIPIGELMLEFPFTAVRKAVFLD